jgi:hypothetical protein
VPRAPNLSVVLYFKLILNLSRSLGVATPLWGKCEDETHTPKSGNLESFGTPTTSELDCRGLEVFFILLERSQSVNVENGLTWAIQTSIAQIMTKRRAESQTGNWTPDREKSGIDPAPGCAEGVQQTVGKLLRRATSLLETSFQSEVWVGSYDLPKFREFKLGQSSDSSVGVPGIKAIWMRVRWSNAKNTIWGKVVASPEFGPWWIQWISVARDLSQHQRCFQRWTNPLMVGFGCKTE